jgi:hypothetical protein
MTNTNNLTLENIKHRGNEGNNKGGGLKRGGGFIGVLIDSGYTNGLADNHPMGVRMCNT